MLVGLSGGVDSAVAALILQRQGYDVTGVTMAIYDGPDTTSTKNACYDCREKEDIASAETAAEILNIPFHVFDCVEQYKAIVLSYFRDTYLKGKTPNPCVRCNHLMKFGVLPKLAEKNGIAWDYFATGHYVRKEYSGRFNTHVLMQGDDRRKDQSYFLYRLSQEQIRRSLFPLGGMSKQEVRAIAAANKLPMHDTPDSQDFYSGDYSDLLGMPKMEGNIIDAAGTVIGRHAGFWNFTPGQRKGLGVSAAAPLYVVRVDAFRNEVVVGPYEQTLSAGCVLERPRFSLPLDKTGHTLQARIRSSQELMPVIVDVPIDNTLRVTFAQPQSGVAPGQSLVLYLDGIVVGGGIIR